MFDSKVICPLRDSERARLDRILPVVPKQVYRNVYEKNSEEPIGNRHDNAPLVLNT